MPCKFNPQYKLEIWYKFFRYLGSNLLDNGMSYKDVTHKIKDWMVEMEFYEAPKGVA